MNFVARCTVSGLAAVALGHLSSLLFNRTTRKECADWNRAFVMQRALFLTGAMLYAFNQTFLFPHTR